MLLLACPFEILPDGPEAKPEPKALPGIVKAFDAMGYDAGALTPDEAAYLEKAGAPLPARFTVLGDAPQTQLLQKGGTTYGLVFFPASPDLKKPVPEALLDAAAQAAHALRGKANVVIGISGLGLTAEQDFLDKHPGAVDILLGSGPNAGTSSRLSADARTLLSRTYIKGKTLNRLDIDTLPGASGFTWKPGQNFKTDVISLDDRYPADPAVEKVLGEE
ncbi:hypothetical protein [Solidesulfovibrio sp.]|uniref:UshA-like (seleno)protein family 2 n=1 Tax=Solidesulfovibrio sp. TaxID=2910990 RepID=UPI002B219D37|nr:hypothetical protein [Solidesulfovibrio sp.]MEA5090542.1 hypothetical protein [Solidesulfovibrio sp.]HML59894.1 hypothetical protein [Solidesulfovibrio sp.]